jgi:thymidine phosphorylase
MSKKIAEGTAALVLDVKFGSGAFMQDPERSRELAETMVRLGQDAGVATRALLTDMNVPLGLAIGNANEVRESVEVLAGGGPADVVELTVALAREMLDLAGVPGADVEGHLAGGQAMDTWRAMIQAQGGDPDAALPAPKETHVVSADRDGILVKQEALPFGIAAWRLGAGRARKEDPVHHAAGIDLHVKPGAAVTKGDPLFTLSTDEPSRFERALEALEGAYAIGDEPPVRGPLIADRIA